MSDNLFEDAGSIHSATNLVRDPCLRVGWTSTNVLPKVLAIITLTKAIQAIGRRGQAGEEATVESKAALSAVEITPEMIDAGGGALLSSGWPDDCDAFAAACLVYQAMELAASSRKERLIGVPLGK